MKEVWSTVWPKEEGFYWFYGGYKGEKSRLKTVEVKLAGSEPAKFWAYICEGAFLFPSEIESGAFWLKMKTPELPVIEEEKC